MMMSTPIQPNRSSGSPPFGQQGFIQGRKRLQQQQINTPLTTHNTHPNRLFSEETRQNQAFLQADSNADPAAEGFPTTSYAPPQQQRFNTTATTTNTTTTANSSKPTTSNSLAYQEIQAIAEKAGYIGVSQRDIDRAYRLNKSLLVDYRA
jgi:hypothetical protein